MMVKKKALIVDVRPVCREGLRQMLRQSRFAVVASGPTLADALAQLGPDDDIGLAVCTLDQDFVRVGVRALLDIRGHSPSAKIILLGNPALMSELPAGAIEASDAVLLHDIAGATLVHAIQMVMLGERFISSSLLRQPDSAVIIPVEPEPIAIIKWHEADAHENDHVSNLSTMVSGGDRQLEIPPLSDELPLSERERQILRCLTKGYSNKLIGRELQIADATVKVHVKGLLRKLRAQNRTQAAIWAISHGMLANGVATFNAY